MNLDLNFAAVITLLLIVATVVVVWYGQWVEKNKKLKPKKKSSRK